MPKPSDYYRSKYYRSKRPEIAQFLPKQYANVLEVGCGEGYFATNLNPSCEVWGIEPVYNIAKNALQRLNKVMIGSYKEVCDQLPNHYFDLVICNDVIEHMENHDQFFQSIKEKMKQNAYLVGSVPNVRYVYNLHELLIEKDWLYKDSGILDRTHLRFFTEKSLKRTLNEHGFLIESFKGLKSGITRPSSLKRLAKNIMLLSIIFGSFGFFRDIRFLRFGFRARYTDPSIIKE